MQSSAAQGRMLSYAIASALACALMLRGAEPASAAESAWPSPATLRLAARPAVGAKNAKTPKDKPPKEKPAARKSFDDDNPERVKEPTTFAEAFERGKHALDVSQAAVVGLRIAQNQETVDQETVKQLTAEKAENERAAMADFRLALLLAFKGPAKDRPKPEDLDTARYYLCFLCYDAGQYYEAAVLGDYLAHHAIDKVQARQNAKIVLASYIKLYSESKDADKSFETQKIRETAEFILERWPTEPEAEDAALSLLNFAITDRKLDEAMKYLDRIPADSPRRGQSDLYAGQALWAAYLKASQLPADQRPPQEELDRYKTQAAKVLHEGVERIQKGGEANATIVAAMLSLAQIYLDMNEGQQAIATLEDPKFGPLTLVQAKSPLASKPGFAIETYKVAVRAYVALQQAVKAKAVIDALDKAVAQSADPASKENLNAIYVTIGRELQQQLERLRKDGSKKEIDAASDAFEAILSRIASHSAGNTFASLSWVADTFYSLAAAADDPSLPATDRVKNYYQHAADAYQEILAQAAKDPKFVPGPDDLIRIQLRTAVSLRRTGDFDKAIKLVVEVLKQRPTMLTAQIVGAETYAAQGERERDGYMRSIMGGSPDKQGHNLIWGWSQLATVTQGKPKYEETFYQARLKIAEGRLLYGMTVVDQPQREKIFEAAKNDLWVTYRIYHDLGGPESAAKYDMLLKRIQQQLHQPLEGLREFKEREAAGNKEQDEKAKSA